MKEIETEIQEIKQLRADNRKIEGTITAKKKKVYEFLQIRFSYLLDEKQLEKSKWSPYHFNREIQLLIRSMLKRNEIYKIGDGQNSNSWYLTQQHGLKFPRCHTSHNFIPGANRVKEPQLIDLIFDDGYSKIEFVTLAGRTDIDKEKFEKFIYFLKEIISLYRDWQKINKFLEMKTITGLSSLREWSGVEEFEDFVKNTPELETKYSEWILSVESFNQKRQIFLAEMHDFNKPFRVFLELKKNEEPLV